MNQCVFYDPPSFVLFRAIYLRHGKPSGQRLGQLFCNMFLKDSESVAPGLYNQTNEQAATEQICELLRDYCYIYQLPTVLHEQYKPFLHIGRMGECRHGNSKNECDHCKETQ